MMNTAYFALRLARATFAFLILLSPAVVSAYKPLSDSFLRAIPSPGADIDPADGVLLAPLLLPRIPGTPGHAIVQHHFVEYFRHELPKWSMEWQNSTSRTPTSRGEEVPFANMVFRREPPWVRSGQANLLTLAAHYDSKSQPPGFIGATDSAAPCAILLHVAKVIDKHVQRMYDEMQELGEGGTVEMDMGVQILFLDGEEAFQKWTSEDSLYGSRALVKQWSHTLNPPSAQSYHYRTPLHQIPLFLLLDLLGTPSPSIPSYYPTTHWAYLHLSTLESRLRNLSLLESSPIRPFFADTALPTQGQDLHISDDHAPFLVEGVEVLHVIPHPFPSVWHTEQDNGEALDQATVRDWTRIVCAFVLEWLDMTEVWDEPVGKIIETIGEAGPTTRHIDAFERE